MELSVNISRCEGEFNRMNAFLWKLSLLVAIAIALNIILTMRIEYRAGEYSDIKSYLQHREARSIVQGVASTTHVKNCLVSYVMYAPPDSNDQVHQMCITNANIFLSRGVVNSTRVDYVFNLVGSTSATSQILEAARLWSNVNISRVPNQAIDLPAHMSTIKSSHKSYTYYILLNCGARGPYFMHQSVEHPLIPSRAWISRFIDPLRKGASAVGSTISPEISPHIQTYAMALNYQATKFAMSYWDRFSSLTAAGNVTDKAFLIDNMEVGLSTALIDAGFHIASLDTRMQNLYSRRSNIPGDLYDNPTACRRSDTRNSSGCEGVNPCEVIFVKYGGEILREGLVPSATIGQFSMEDTNALSENPHMCDGMVDPYRPYWDIPSIFKNISAQKNAANWVGVDLVSELAIIVRVHASYSTKLISLLWILESSAAVLFKQIRVFVVPTDEHSVIALRDILDEHWNKQQNKKLPPMRVRVSLMEFPAWLYQEHGTYLESLCHNDYKARALKLYQPFEIVRYCSVNSPLHYLLCDLTLHYIASSVPSCQWVVTTNADNFYSMGFFDNLANTSSSEYDVMMSNMLTRGNVLETSAAVGGVDLGAYAVSMRFLNKWKSSFLNSLPTRSGPRHYHNADGHFIEHLVSKNARIKKIPGFFFIHN
jgi:hypothetical protein